MDWCSDASVFEERPPDIKKKIIDLLPEMESTMDWYDHIAFGFLAYPTPSLALQKMKALVENQKQGKLWQDIVISPLVKEENFNGNNDSAKLIIEVLQVLQQNKLLNYLEIFEPKDKIFFIDQFRLELFQLIDQLEANDVKKFVQTMNSQIGLKEDHIYPCIEMHILEWMDHKIISPENRLKLDHCLEVIGLGPSKTVQVNKNQDIYQTPNPVSMQSLGIQELKTFTINKGLCIIINQMEFYINPNLPPEILKLSKKDLAYRFGSDLDRDNLAETFRLLSHEVEVYENLTHQRMLDTFYAISRRNFTLYDALTVCVLSHGERESIMSSDSIPLSLDRIKSFFDGVNCPLLATKPKLFFIQACQGNDSQRCVNVEEYQHDGAMISHRLPAICNFIEAWATVPGFASYRSIRQGAVFVRRLCHIFRKFGHLYNLIDLLTMVNQEVSSWNTADFKKQVSVISSSLCGKVEFRRDGDKLVEALLNSFENNLFERTIELATHQLITRNRSAFFKLNSLHPNS